MNLYSQVEFEFCNSELKFPFLRASIKKPVAQEGTLSLVNDKPLTSNFGWGLFYVRPAGRTYLEVEVLYRPDRGNG